MNTTRTCCLESHKLGENEEGGSLNVKAAQKANMMDIEESARKELRDSPFSQAEAARIRCRQIVL